MRCWIVSPFDPLPGEGFTLLRYGLLAKALVAQGHDVLWWSSDFHHGFKKKRDVPQDYTLEGIRIRLVASLPYYRNVSLRRWKSHLSFGETWQRVAGDAVCRGEAKPDVIVVSQPPLGLFQRAETLRKTWRCRIVLDVQDLWPEAFGQVLPRPLRWISRGVFARAYSTASRAYRLADAVSVVSPKYIDRVRNVRGEVPEVMRLGRSLPEVRSKSCGHTTGLRLAYVGSLGVSYGISTMLSAVIKCADEGLCVSLDVAGAGEQRELVVKAVKKKPRCVRYHGYLGEEELAQLLSSVHGGIVPMRDSSHVGVPNKVVDYAAFGLPMLYGLSGDTHGLLQEYNAGDFYLVDNVESLAQGIRLWVQDAGRLSVMGARARQLAEENTNGERIAADFARWLTCVKSVAPEWHYAEHEQ